MARQPLSPVQQQVARVSRLLFVQTLLNQLAWCWAGALAAVAVWFLVHPLLLGHPDEWFRWAVAGAALGVGTLAALVLAWLRAPSALAAALALDEKFGLKERVTTSLGLSPQEAQSPAGQALLADVNQRLQPLNVRDRFRVRLSWSAALVPVCAAVLAVVTLFYEPSLGTATGTPARDDKNAVANAKEVEKQIESLKKTKRVWPKDEPNAEKLKEIEAAWDKLVKQPLDPNNKEEIRERVQAMRDLEEKMKDRLDGLKAKADTRKQQLGRLGAKDEGGKADFKEGPAKELKDALAQGDVARAKEEIDRLTKKLAEDKLNPEEEKKLAEQMEELKNRLQRLADLKDRKDQLRRDREQGKIDDEQLERELDELNAEAQDLQELNDLALDLGECMDCLRKGDRRGAAAKLAKAAKLLEKLELDEQQLEQLQEAAEGLEDAREMLCEALNGQCDADGKMNGLGKGRRPGTKRPIAADAPTNTKDARQRAEVDARGKQRVTGFTKGGIFSKVPAREVGGAFRQAVQDAPEAIERQRVPPDATEMLKGYYQNLGGQKRN